LNALNAILSALGDVAFGALSWLSPLGTLLVLSAVCGVLMTIAFRYTSNQPALRRVADQTRANLLAIKLFKDDLRVTLRAQGALLRATGLRLWHSLRPMAILIIPFFFVLVQLGLRYEHVPPRPGEPIFVSVHMTPAAFEQAAQSATLETPAGVSVEVERFPDAGALTLDWRVRADRPLEGVLRFRLPGSVVEKRLSIGSPAALPAVAVVRPAAGDWWARLLHPAEPATPSDSGVRSITVQVEPRQTAVFGWNVPWWATFLVVSIVVALLVRRFFGVQF
jgi:hypothetical protein